MTTPIEPNPPRWSPSSDPTSIIVPGLDTTAPINDQIDQIEQLITIKLQNIDANFSKIQHIMATKLLPAVKRYAVGTEPVREAAKFWTSFYEQAAQVRIPTLEDDESMGMHDEETQPSAVAAPPSEPASFAQPEEEDSIVTPSRTMPSGAFDVTASESSFMPSNAVSSTPARPGQTSDRTVDDQPSWSASLESPMVRLKTQLQSFAREEEEEPSVRQDMSSLTDSIMYDEENTIQQLPQTGQRKTEKAAPRPEADERAKNQRSQIPRSALPTPRSNMSNAHVSPLKVKPKTPTAIPKNIQYLLPAKLEKEPTFPSPRRPRFERTPKKPTTASSSTSTSVSASSSTLDIPSLTKHASSDTNQGPKFTMFNDSFDDSVELMQGMSPPRTLAFAKAPRSSVGLGLLPPLGRTPGKDTLPTLGRTPGREAADRIRRDLLGDMQGQFGSRDSTSSNKMRTPAFGYGVSSVKDDTMSTIPTPPSLSRYTRHAYPSWTDSNNDDTDTSLATMMHRLGLEMPETSYKADSSHSRSRASSQAEAESSLHVPSLKEELQTPSQQALDMVDQGDQSRFGLHARADQDSDSDSDSLDDEPVHSSHPSTAFLMASSREPGPDDSFGSSNSNHSSDSLGADEFGGGDEAAVHPFARAMEASGEDGFDDSFDSEACQGEDPVEPTDETVFGIPPAQRRQQARDPGQLRMLGEDLLQDTIGIGNQLAKVGRVEESPTPYARG